jgi:ParB/Sulfiredoxin domain
MNKASFIAAQSRLAVTYRAISDLIPDPRNARTHPRRQIEQLKKSIEAFGFTNPILADPEGRIIAGHGRLQAARAMGFSEVPTVILSGLSETQKRALRIADNKTQAKSRTPAGSARVAAEIWGGARRVPAPHQRPQSTSSWKES